MKSASKSLFIAALALLMAGAVRAEYSPIVLHVDPDQQTVAAGQTVKWYLMAEGTAPLRYEWRLNGKAIPGANASTLTIASADGADAGLYTCQVQNKWGEAVSIPLKLDVTRQVAGKKDPKKTRTPSALGAAR